LEWDGAKCKVPTLAQRILLHPARPHASAHLKKESFALERMGLVEAALMRGMDFMLAARRAAMLASEQKSPKTAAGGGEGGLVVVWPSATCAQAAYGLEVEKERKEQDATLPRS